ncbi:hypothetical protein BSL78_22462 [Apostichopus japonicus]|uniref:Uncharacterized protein n=1 Tax=Stichopus japonicus TaxID=307972 RepID=A0A2G8JY78_STIJA|nr:hypothetical protein BSL78_22462 [Apostichopus japonicus]
MSPRRLPASEVHVLEGVEGLKVTPYDSSVWVTVLHLPLDMSEQVVVRTLGRFGKVTGYEEPEFLECKGVKTGTRPVRINSSPISPLPCGLMGTGPTLHTRASLALVGGVGWKGMRPGCARTSGVAAVYRLGIPWPSVKGISLNSCGKTGHLARLCPDRSYAARVATGVVEAVPSRPLTPYH